MLVKFDKSHYLYFMGLNTIFFPDKGSVAFTRISKGSMSQKWLRTPPRFREFRQYTRGSRTHIVYNQQTLSTTNHIGVLISP